MVYEGKPARTRASRNREKKKSLSVGKTEIKLIICLWALFIVMLVKLVFPEALDTVKAGALKAIGSNVDFKSAVEVLSEVANSDKKLSDAIPEALHYAFNASNEDVEVSLESESEESLTEETIELSDNAEPTSTELNFYNVPITDMEDADADVESVENTDPYAGMVAAFKESQQEYSELSKPYNVSFERTELGIVGTVPASGEITSGFGYREHPVDGQIKFHYGIDIGASLNSDIVAFADGTVSAVGDSSTLGLYVIVKHDGFETLYAHLSDVLIETGSEVKQEDKIALSGDSGNATGACLHFEMTVDGVYVNPQYYI